MDIKAAGHGDINAVLQQMRMLREQATQPLKQTSELDVRSLDQTQATGTKLEFGAALENAVQSVNQLQKTAGDSATAFARGEEKDLVKVMIDSQKSSIGFEAMVQVRNRMVTAYQDIMNMPI